MERTMRDTAVRRLAFVLFVAACILPTLDAQSGTNRTRVALYGPAGDKNDTTLSAVLSTVADSVELSLALLQRYEVIKLPAADPATALDEVRAYCRKNHIDQAILGSGSARSEGGYSFRLLVYDRKTDQVTTDKHGASNGALDMFDVTDALVAALLDGLSGTHLLFGSLAVDSDPAGATVSVNGKEVGQAPLSLRGLPAGSVELTARMDGREGAKTTVTISDGETTNASLSLPRSMGTLAVEMPKDAVAAIRSAEVGRKEIAGPGTSELPTGDYDFEASSPGLPSVTGKVTVNRSESTHWLPWPKGYLDVQSDPAGATIVVDGVERGLAPQVIEVEPGALHRVELRKQNYQTYSADFSEDAGSKTLFARTLTASQPGVLTVGVATAGTLEVAGRKLLIAAGDSIALSDLPPGPYMLRVTYDDGKTESRAVTVAEGRTLQISFEYKPASIEGTIARGSVLLKGIPGNVEEITVTSRSDPESAQTIRVAGLGEQQIPNLLAEDLTKIEFKTKDATRATFSMTVTPKAHKEVDLQVPSGTVSFPYLPDHTQVVFSGQVLALSKGNDGRAHSESILAQKYDLRLRYPGVNDFADTVDVNPATETSVKVPVEYLSQIYTAERNKQAASLRKRRTLGTAGWISFLTSGLALAATGGSYYFGNQQYSTFVSLSSTDATRSTALQQIHLFTDVFWAGIGVGGTGLGTAVVLWILGSREPIKKDDGIKLLDRQISSLGLPAGGGK
jgi:hypothetical protein